MPKSALHGLDLVAFFDQLGRSGVAELVNGVARGAGLIEQARPGAQLPGPKPDSVTPGA